MPRELAIRLKAGDNPEKIAAEEWRQRAAAQLQCDAADVREARMVRYSLDARPDRMGWQVQLRVWMTADDEDKVPENPATTPPEIPMPPADAPHVAIVGSGPAGLFAALTLLKHGVRVSVFERGPDVQTRRRGVAMLNRRQGFLPENNYAFGEGGAGTFSDGKLYTRSTKRGDVQAVLETFVAHGAPPRILASWRPHIGSNRLPKVVTAIRHTIQRAGGQIRFQTRVDELLRNDTTGRIVGVQITATTNTTTGDATTGDATTGEVVAADAVILATGHSALDAVKMAARAGATLEPKGFAMGVRIEHPQKWLDAIQYRGLRETAELPASFYELATQIDGRGVFSFCMCPGGWIVPSQACPNTLVVNGMSLSRRDSPFANSGLVVAIEPSDWCGKTGAKWGWPELLRKAATLSDHPMLHEKIRPATDAGTDVENVEAEMIDVARGRLPAVPAADPLFGVRLQVALETVAFHAGGGTGEAPAQRADLFVANRPMHADQLVPSSFRPGLAPANFADWLPRGMTTRLRQAMRVMDRRLPGFAGSQGQIIGVETRTSSPVRLPRDPLTQESLSVDTPHLGLFPAGEGAGFAGGIVSAALDGIAVARSIVARLSECSA